MTSVTHDHRIPVTLLTGFLGAGKTTVLNHLLRQPGMESTAALINEFGSVGVDHHLVEKIDEDLMLLDSGCICCTVRSDLTRSLGDLFKRCIRRELKPIRRVIIETTGLADPAPVIYTLMQDFFIADRFRMDGVITIADPSHIVDQLGQHREAVKQIAMADRLILSKCDLVERPALEAASQAIRRINPSAPQIYIRRGELAIESIVDCGMYEPSGKTPDVAAWLGEETVRAERQHHHHHHDVDRHDAHVHSFALTFDTPIRWLDLCEALDLALNTMGDRILRIKGLIHVAGCERPRVIQCVQHVSYPSGELESWPNTPPYNDRKSRLVFIVRDLQRSLVEQAFHMLCAPEAATEVARGARATHDLKAQA